MENLCRSRDNLAFSRKREKYKGKYVISACWLYALGDFYFFPVSAAVV
jgi:hypothetical protein